MLYYLRHPVHGAKVAISEMEMAADCENGWEEYDPADPDVDEASGSVVANNLSRKRRRKASQSDSGVG